MLIKASSLKDYKLVSLDGELGKVKEFYFDDKHWTIRYLVADTGNWLTGKQVLISPYALKFADKDEQNIEVNLTKKQIEDSPSLNSDRPVSQQFEQDYYGYYGWSGYWNGPYMWGMYPNLLRGREIMDAPIQNEKKWDPSLRSTLEIIGYNIQAADGEIGHISDFIIDDETWAIRYIIIATQNWWPGKKVILSPKWFENVNWSESKIFTKLSQEEIKQSPEYTEESLLSRDYESSLHHHYNRQGYWLDEHAAK
jgi:sporulation protein YlmC with PRC-barrel domain